MLCLPSLNKYLSQTLVYSEKPWIYSNVLLGPSGNPVLICHVGGAACGLGLLCGELDTRLSGRSEPPYRLTDGFLLGVVSVCSACAKHPAGRIT